MAATASPGTATASPRRSSGRSSPSSRSATRAKFLLRPRGGGKSTPFELGRGDLLVTGGRTQRLWQHSVPKVANAAGPRISLAFRHGMAAKVYD